ncbi:DMT family transporter [Clostridiaceae bacterium M8S5]|nr:DMT family transporter [Clostridiaceae bacterium M8S5]
MVFGIIYSIIAGTLISVQSVFNARLGDKVGVIEATAIVHGVGLIVAIALASFFGDGDIKKITQVNKLYLIGGALGVMIIFSITKSIGILGGSFSITILLIAQLITITVIDLLGLFDTPKVQFDYTKPLGIFIMIVGIVVFKLKG